MAASSSNQSFYQYPYPSHVFVPSFVTVKLNGKNTYNVWNYQMLSLLRSHDMFGFINGQFVSPNQKAKEEDMQAWIRSDSLVRGWILGSLSDQVAINVVNRLTSRHKNTEFTAKDAWDELQRIYGPALPMQPAVKGKMRRTVVDMRRAEGQKTLYWCILNRNLFMIDHCFERNHIGIMEDITTNGNTALHVAVGSSINNHEVLEHLLRKVPETNNLWDVRNLNGRTLLHVAAIVGNTQAAKILLQRSPCLLLAEDKKGHTPLAISLSNMHSETSLCMLDNIEADNEHRKYDTLFTGPSGDELLVLAISSKEFRLAARLLKHYKTIHSEAVLMAIAQNFPSDLGFWGRLTYIEDDYYRNEDVDEYYTYDAWAAAISESRDIIKCTKIIIMAIVWPFVGKRFHSYHYASYLMDTLYHLISKSSHLSRDFSNHHLYYISNPVFEATRQNAYNVVRTTVDFFPDAIWSVNEDGHNFIQYSVINRSEKIYNLLYEMSEHRNIYKTIEDSSGNNLLHLAARLAPTNKLNSISGAALQMQRELQWFKEVEGFVCPLNTIQKNSTGETPEMVFSREHKELVIEGEKWMKATANSYTITAALITTIVFAAAITVPGGNDQNTGTPIFTNKVAFTIFAISDAVSLFTAVTSLLMFLSILTTRFSEEDFLFKLPKRLIIGLATLFISTTAMIIAFGATLFLVFGQGSLWVLIPIGALTCLPIISFVSLQFPLIIDLISATYGRSIFVKTKPDEPVY